VELQTTAAGVPDIPIKSPALTESCVEVLFSPATNDTTSLAATTVNVFGAAAARNTSSLPEYPPAPGNPDPQLVITPSVGAA
jgi:hypothetical protein